MNIQYYINHQYGHERRFLSDKNIEGAIFLISGKKTLSDEIQKGLETLGHTFEEVNKPKKETQQWNPIL